MTEKPLISVLIPLYRGQSTVRDCLQSVLAQEDVRLEILLLDNGCPDDTGEWAGYFLSQAAPSVSWNLLEEENNIGFAAGMNRLYVESTGPWVLFLNQDVTLEPDHMHMLVNALESNEKWGGACGTLFRVSERDGKKVIDTTGHEIFRDRIVRNRGTGMEIEPGEKLPWKPGPVFGLSGACSMFRRAALEGCREPEGPFDPGFFAYFEDIDLDYRMHRAGWTLGWVPDARGTHVLGGSGARKELQVRLRAYGNRRRIFFKHESASSLLPDIGPIFLQDIYGWLTALITDPLAWMVGPYFLWRDLADILNRRKAMDEKWGTGRRWIREWLRPENERWSKR